MNNAKTNSESIFTTMVITVLSFLFFVASAVFVLGPSLMAYALGANKNRYKRYGFSTFHALLSMAIGEFVFFIVSSLILKNIIYFYQPEIYWYVVIGSLLLNYSLSVGFYYLGMRRIKN